jgi:large subunit ribosomal protein L15
MVSKTKKYRGSRTHGRGRKAGRGAGLRGGRGKAGLHKHKYKRMLKYFPDHFGDYGFKRPPGSRKEKVCINIMKLEEALPKLLKDGLATKENDTVHVNLESLGIHKLLSRGVVRTKLRLEVREASNKAKVKVEAFGGAVVLGDTDQPETKKESEGIDA